MNEVQRLGAAIDLIARRCYRGVPALLGKAPRPSHDDLKAAVLYRPASMLKSRQEAKDWVATAACCMVDFEADLALAPWGSVVAATVAYSRLEALDWSIYVEHVRLSGMTLTRDSGGPLTRLALRFGRAEDTIGRIVRDVPVNVAWSAIVGVQLDLFGTSSVDVR